MSAFDPLQTLANGAKVSAINDQAQAQRRVLILAIVALAVFAGCCAVIYWGHGWVSQSAVATYALLAVAAVSALAGPIFIGRALSKQSAAR